MVWCGEARRGEARLREKLCGCMYVCVWRRFGWRETYRPVMEVVVELEAVEEMWEKEEVMESVEWRRLEWRENVVKWRGS